MTATICDLPSDQRRRAALSIAAAAATAVALLVAMPIYLAYRHYGGALSAVLFKLERYERLAAARPALDKKLEAVNAQGGRGLFLKASTPSLASSEVQDRVRQFVEKAGGRVVSLQVAQPRDEGRYRQVGITLQFNANMSALRQALVGIEGVEPYLFVDALTIRSQVPPGFKPAPGFDPEVFVQMDIAAFVLAS